MSIEDKLKEHLSEKALEYFRHASQANKERKETTRAIYTAKSQTYGEILKYVTDLYKDIRGETK